MKLFNLGITALTAVFATALIGQSTDATSSAPENTLKVNSRAVLVDVIVTDKNGNPVEVPEVVPETEEEIELYNGALRRRQLRLILSGRMKPHEANELKSLFDFKGN